MESDSLCVCCNWHEKNPAPHGREEGAGSACRAIWRRGIPMGSGASYNEQALLWKVIRFVWAVTGMSANQFAFMRAYRIRGARQAEPARNRTCRPNVRRAKFLWEAMRPIMSGGSYGK